MKFYYVYIVLCLDLSFYTGITSNLDKRIQDHNDGKHPDAYTFLRRPVELKWFEKFTNAQEAIAWEKQIKGWSRRKKKALIAGDWESLIEFSKNYTEYGHPDSRKTK
ncbi:GIY-YIG nuclease family protein [Gramella sp. AN32]|uniref:GIY-YIG nuclease family protein n=1 Tax=Christiangramia antarctica TaxID=2058158 RepID=A0ABW5XB05_9FLAO|nr:GIY-YIG nuclease family protein [Gramella sp. AN32]MCM4155324.1 hypothetical protein [Gramella sp. AN32]